MLPPFVACLILLTGATIYMARDAFYFGTRRAFWLRSALSVPLVAISVAALWLMIWQPHLSVFVPLSPLWPGWNCETYGSGGAVVCFKQ